MPDTAGTGGRDRAGAHGGEGGGREGGLPRARVGKGSATLGRKGADLKGSIASQFQHSYYINPNIEAFPVPVN